MLKGEKDGDDDDDDKTGTSYDWKYTIWSDELFFMLFPTTAQTPNEAYNPECLVPTAKHGGRSVMIWAAISWCSAGPVSTLSSQLTVSDYMGISGNQVHPVVQMLLPNNDAIFQDDNLPIHTVSV